MTREEAIENLKGCVCGYEVDKDGKPNGNVTADLTQEIIEMAIKALEQQPRWIPVSERLPKAGEYVGNVEKYYLVQNEYGDMLVARYTHSGYWEQIYQLKPYADEIVARMPLPEPYMAESEDA